MIGAGTGFALGFSYNGGHPELFERIAGLVGYVEVTPDSLATVGEEGARIAPGSLRELSVMSSAVEIVVHGVGLSIGSHDGMSERYIRLLDQIVEHVPVAWHSEHLGYVSVDGTHIGTMVPVPHTTEALDIVVDRVLYIQDRYRLPFLLENVVHLLPERASQMTDAGFLNHLVSATGCGLLLDVYNLWCDAQNNGVDPAAFLEELDLRTVREVHVAGGVEHAGLVLDVHSRAVAPRTLDLARDVIDAAAGSVRGVTFELLDEALPVWGDQAIVNELNRVREALVRGRHGSRV